MRAFGKLGWSRGLAALTVLVWGCGGLRASTVPLGGKREVEATPRKAEGPALPRAAEAPALTPDDEASAATVEVVEAASPPPAAASASVEPPKPAAPGAFVVRPYAAGQTWTRSFDLEMALKVGPDLSLDMRMVSHQDARFEVLAVSSGTIEKLQIDYPSYTSKIQLMGAPQQESPEAISGKRYIITFRQGKPDVREQSGSVPPKKELDTVNDDAREPLEMAKALVELAQLSAKGTGDFGLAGAIALAGGEDDDTKIPRAKASLRSLALLAGARTATIELGYTLVSELDDGGSLEATVAGTLLALDAPARYQSVTLQGPVELKSADASGMQGKGTLKVTTSYKH